MENLSRIIHRSVGRYPLDQKRKRAQEATDTMDATTARTTKQETRFHPYPEWRERLLQKCIASGRYGAIAPPAYKAELRRNTGAYELSRELQEWRENEEVESWPGSMMSDAEWEGWRRELELEGPTQPGSPEPLFVTESDGLLRRRRRNNAAVSGRDKALKGILKRTTELPIHPHLPPRDQPSGVLTSSPVSPKAVIFVDMLASSGAAVRPPSSCSNSAPTSPRQSLSVSNRARPVSLATSIVPPKPSSYHTRDATNDLGTLLPNPRDAPEAEQLPGLGGGLSPSHRPYQTQMVTTITTLRSADNEATPKKGMARVWSNKGKRRDETEDNPTSEDANVESPLLAVDDRNDTWTRSHIEGLDRLRHMSPSGLRQPGSKGGLFKSFNLRDR